MIKFLGVAHNEEKSIKRINEALDDEDPDCVALELSPKDLSEVKYFEVERFTKEFNNPSIYKRFINEIIEILTIVFLFLLSPFIKLYSNVKISKFYKDANISNFNLVNINEFVIALNYCKQNEIDVYGIDYSIKDMQKLYLFRNKIKNLLNTPKIMLKNSFLTGSSSRYFHIDPYVNEEREKFMIDNLKKLEEEYENIICIIGEEHLNTINSTLQDENTDTEVIWRRFGEDKLNKKPWFLRP